jgi:ribosomal protein S18 acetylase RimI-like enzyme
MARKKKIARRRGRPGSPAVEIREMKLTDLHEVFELGQKLFTAEKLPTLYRSWDEDAVIELFGSDRETCLVAENGKSIVGFALGAMMEKPNNAWRYGWLEWLAVSPRYKRHGLATRLLARLIELFIVRDARIVLVDTDEENHEAIAFFRRRGFGQDLRHVYLSLNLENHPRYIERKDAEGKMD